MTTRTYQTTKRNVRRSRRIARQTEAFASGLRGTTYVPNTYIALVA